MSTNPRCLRAGPLLIVDERTALARRDNNMPVTVIWNKYPQGQYMSPNELRQVATDILAWLDSLETKEKEEEVESDGN